jgi:hypothetical protein
MPFLSPGFVDFNDLSKVWQLDQPHVAVRWLRASGSRCVPLPFKAARPPGAGQGDQRGLSVVVADEKAGGLFFD